MRSIWKIITMILPEKVIVSNIQCAKPALNLYIQIVSCQIVTQWPKEDYNWKLDLFIAWNTALASDEQHLCLTHFLLSNSPWSRTNIIIVTFSEITCYKKTAQPGLAGQLMQESYVLYGIFHIPYPIILESTSRELKTCQVKAYLIL